MTRNKVKYLTWTAKKIRNENRINVLFKSVIHMQTIRTAIEKEFGSGVFI